MIRKAKLEYVTTRTDNFNNELSYFKTKDKSILQKLKQYSEDSDFKLPSFSSNKGGSTILKAKQKYVKVNSLPRNDETHTESTKYTDIN